MTWTPVAERLPDDDVAVLIAVGGESGEPVWIGWHDEDGWHDTSAAPCVVTHWQNIPEGPDDE